MKKQFRGDAMAHLCLIQLSLHSRLDMDRRISRYGCILVKANLGGTLWFLVSVADSKNKNNLMRMLTQRHNLGEITLHCLGEVKLQQKLNINSCLPPT